MTPDELRSFRRRAGLSQSGLAARLGMATGTVARWEQGRRRMPPWLPLALSSYKLLRSRLPRHGRRGPQPSP